MNAKITEIHDYIISSITDKVFAVNDKLPTEMELAKKFDTNRMNAQLAMKELVSKGIVKRIRKKGSFVCRSINKQDVNKLNINSASNIHIICFQDKAHKDIHWDETTLASLEKTIAPKGFLANFHALPPDNIVENLKELISDIDSEPCGGIVIFPNTSDVFCSSHLNFLLKVQNQVYIFNNGKEPFNFPAHVLSLYPINEGYEAGKFLKEKKCKNILYLFYENVHFEKDKFLKERYEGLLTGMGVGEKNLPIFQYDRAKNKTDLYEICDRIKASKEKLCIVAANDEMAVDFINAAHDKGLSTPDDFNTLSFDNSPEFRMYNLTTVAPQLELVGEILGQLINDNSWLTQNGCYVSIKIPSKLISRKTFN